MRETDKRERGRSKTGRREKKGENEEKKQNERMEKAGDHYDHDV